MLRDLDMPTSRPPKCAPGEDASKADVMLNRREIAKHLRVSTRTISEWQEERIIPYIKVRKIVLFHWPDVVAHLRENYSVVPKAEIAKAETLKSESGAHGVRRPTSGGTPQ